jgi:hypothetical protein
MDEVCVKNPKMSFRGFKVRVCLLSKQDKTDKSSGTKSKAKAKIKTNIFYKKKT